MIKSNLNKPIGILLFLSLISIYFFLWSNLNINSAELNIETPISEVENCKYKIANFEDYLIANKFDYVIETKFVSYIPELKNLSCYGLISDLQISNTDVIHIYINQSLVLKNILFIVLTLLVFLILFFWNLKNLIFIVAFNLFNFIYLSYFLQYLVTRQFINIYFTVFTLFTCNVLYELNKNKKFNFDIFLFYILFILISLFSHQGVYLENNEPHYIGQLRSSPNSLSSYIDNPRFYFSLIIDLLENFGNNYLLYLRPITTLIFTFIFFQFKKILKIHSFLYLFVLFTFLNFGQSYFGGNYFIGYIEPRTFFYIFFFASLIFLNYEKLSFSILFFTLSLYFHLAEGIIYFPIFLSIVLMKHRLREVFKNSYFSVLVIPLLIRTLQNPPLSSYESYQGFIIDRAPHHLFPFASSNQFSSDTWKFGFIVYVLVFITITLFNKKLKISSPTFLYTRISGILIFLYFLFIYIFPISSFAVLGPYRVLTFFTFFSLCAIALIFQILLSKYSFEKLLIVISIFFSIYSFIQIDYKIYLSDKFFNSRQDIVVFFRTTNPELVLVDSDLKNKYISIEHESKIPTYVERKFVPHDLSFYKIWESRLLSKNLFFEGDCSKFDTFKNLYFISNKDNLVCGNIIKNTDDVYIYTLISK